MIKKKDIKGEIINLKEELINLRRDFHKYPELGFEEYRTSKIVADYLEECGLKVTRGIAKTGVMGLLEGKNPGPTLLLRADMDALPIQEENEVPYRSVNNGIMHACGHDAHTAILLITAKILSSYREEIKGNIKFIFQPNEEIGGAKVMIEEGILENPHVDAAMALHVSSHLKSETIGLTAGAATSTMDVFKIIVEGKGGHTAYPQDAIDPIIASANIIQTIQAIQTREISALEPNIIMFGKINGGTKSNIIPDKVILEGTIRYFKRENEKKVKKVETLHEKFERIVEAICKAHRANYTLDICNEDQSIINDDNMVSLVKLTAESVLGSKDKVILYKSTGSEDFSEFSARVPSVFYYLGTGSKNKDSNYPHHNPCFNIEEDAMLLGVEMHVISTLNYFNLVKTTKM